MVSPNFFFYYLSFDMSAHFCLLSPSAALYAHLQSENVEFMQFAFRWMNCLLMREISVQNTIRMWDTYLVGSSFLILICSAKTQSLTDRILLLRQTG